MRAFKLYSIPIACALALALAWVLRPGRVPAPTQSAQPTVTVWCVAPLQLPVTAIAEAFYRRHAIGVDLRFADDDDLEGMAELVEPGAPAVIVRDRATARPIGEPDEAVQAFLHFLEGPLAASLFDRYGVE